jgi:hypothetical protein
VRLEDLRARAELLPEVGDRLCLARVVRRDSRVAAVQHGVDSGAERLLGEEVDEALGWGGGAACENTPHLRDAVCLGRESKGSQIQDKIAISVAGLGGQNEEQLFEPDSYEICNVAKAETGLRRLSS